MRVECSNKGHPDSDSCIVFARSSLRDPQKGRDHCVVYLFGYFLTKKATVPYMKQWLPDGHDSQVIPEENTGTYWLDMNAIC